MLLGPAITEAEGEWWAGVQLVLLGLAAAFWIITFGAILYVPVALLSVDVGVRMVLAMGWLGTTAAGVLAGRRLSQGPGGGGWLPTVVLVVPSVFVLGAIGAVALLVAYLVNDPAVSFSAGSGAPHRIAVYLQGVKGTSWATLVLYGFLMLFLYRLASELIEVNLFSLHAMYANRLIRGYLGRRGPRRTGGSVGDEQAA